MNVEYLHAFPIGGTYATVGEIVRMGQVMAIVDARILNEQGKLLARGTCIYQIPRPK
jgi:acyl-coenzyme A thioesterase PaaI-like protein